MTSPAVREGHPTGRAIVATLAIVLAFGCVSAAARFDAIALDRRIGQSDTAAYAEMGRSLAEGRGLTVRYISTFYYPYDRAIDRLDDHWPPLMGVLIAPFFATLGVSAFNAKIPAVLMGAIGLPLATAWLGIVVSRRAWVGAAAGLLMIVNRQLFAESLTTLCDVTLAALLTAFCAALCAARSQRRLYVAAGLLGVLAYYAKMSEVILAGLFPVLSFLIAGPRVLTQRWMYAGWAVLVAGILPWQLANAVVYGSPLHSIQNHVSGFIALDVWEQAHYRPYWGEDLPRTSDRWTEHADAYWPLTRRQREEYARLVLLGSDTGQADWYRLGSLGVGAFALLRGEDVAPSPRRTEPDTPLMKQPEGMPPDPATVRNAAAAGARFWARTAADGTAALAAGWRALLAFVTAEHRATLVPNLLGGLYAACVLLAVPLRAWWRGMRADELRAWPRSWGIVAALVLLGLVHGVLLVYFFSVGARFTFTALPVMAVLGLTGVAAVARRAAAPLRAALERARPDAREHRVRLARITGGMATLALIAFAALRAPELAAWQQEQAGVGRGFRQTPSEQLGTWIARNLSADAVVMNRQPWELRFYSPPGVKTVALPFTSDVRTTLGIAYHYGVTHVIPHPARPQLTAYLERLGPGVTRLAAPVPMYAIDWGAIPHGDVVLPHQTTDARDAARPARAPDERGSTAGSPAVPARPG